MSTTTPPARWPVTVPALAVLLGGVCAVLTWVTEGQVNIMAAFWTCMWIFHLAVGIRAYNRERRDFLAHQASPPTEEKPAP